MTKVRIILSNDFKFSGQLLDENDTHLFMLDAKGRKLTLKKSDIMSRLDEDDS